MMNAIYSAIYIKPYYSEFNLLSVYICYTTYRSTLLLCVGVDDDNCLHELYMGHVKPLVQIEHLS